uniref:Uncharacterized protein n=1 Tax=Mycena chlorophos TaxID=658473 RepID=A0ABQ0L4P0_MYCCL|nr:predicted protein [Mycena chlorophos]
MVGIQQRYREWKAALPPPWNPNPTFRHGEGTRTYTQTDAKCVFHLSLRELSILPYEERDSDNRTNELPNTVLRPMKLYSGRDLLILAQAKQASVGKKFIPGRPVSKFQARRRRQARMRWSQEQTRQQFLISSYFPPSEPV